MRSITQVTLRDWNQGNYIHRSDPVLITDGAADWPAVTKWTPRTLGERLTGKLVHLCVSHSGLWRYNPDGSAEDPESQYKIPFVPFECAIEWILRAKEHGPKYYVSEVNIDGWLPELGNDVPFCPPAKRTNLWLGSAATVTSLHYDREHNLFAQIYGAKEFILFNPIDTPRLYAHPPDAHLSNLSYVNLDKPDLQRYPLFERVEPTVLTLHPGQILFLPAYWWHHVRAMSISISVNRWWMPPLVEYCWQPNALKFLITEYLRDRCVAFRTVTRLNRSELIDIAESLLNRNTSAALLVAALAFEDWDKWTDAACSGVQRPPKHEFVRSSLMRMVSEMSGDEFRQFSRQEVAPIVAAVRLLITPPAMGQAVMSLS